MFTLPLSSQEEYWVGYIRADGCIVRKPRGKVVIFAQKQIEPVQAFKDFIEHEGAIVRTNRTSNFGLNIMHKISSAKPAYALDNLGAKTELEPNLYTSKHFWRGLLDGDGTIMMINHYGRDYPTIAWSGSEHDMNMVSIWLGNLMNCKPPKVGKARSIFRVGINGGKAKFVALHLYDGEYSALPYKREAAMSFKDWQPRVPAKSWKPT